MAPVLTTTYPADDDVGIPLSASIVLTFDRSVDLSTIANYCAMYGAATDQVSGPHPGSFITKTADKPYLLRSPGFKGLVPFDISAEYLDGSDVVADTFEDFVAETAAVVTYRVTLTPKKPLAPEVEYTYQIIGDPDTLGKGISARTVWTAQADVGNTGTGVVESKGSYTGALSDELVVEITTAGTTGVARYKWYWDSLGTSSGKSGRVSNTGYLTLDKGVAVRFSGADFQVGDTYSIHVDPLDRMVLSYKVAFTTTDNEYTVAPTSPSTPAEASPPSSVIPPAPGAAMADSVLRILGLTPEEGSYNISLHTDTIVVTFSDPVDEDTITTDTVQLYAVPVEGIFGGRGSKRSLAFSLEVAGNVLTIRF
jgi:hypothetical protein